MSRKTWMGLAGLLVAGSLAIFGSNAAAEPSADVPAGAPEIKLPEGWTMEDMQACILAGTPGKQHEFLAQGAGQWKGKTTMWMAPDTEPMTTECSYAVSPVMDGRFMKIEMDGAMPGMGSYKGFGLMGFDNVSQKFVGTWIDNQSTGIANGTGVLSDDGKTLTWTYEFNCPVTKKPAVLRQIETLSSPASRKLEMFGADPKSGKEFKMMEIEMTKG